MLLPLIYLPGTFGPKSQRKKPNVGFSDLHALSESISVKDGGYDASKDKDLGLFAN